jgi:hypothetical protein
VLLSLAQYHALCAVWITRACLQALGMLAVDVLRVQSWMPLLPAVLGPSQQGVARCAPCVYWQVSDLGCIYVLTDSVLMRPASVCVFATKCVGTCPGTALSMHSMQADDT